MAENRNPRPPASWVLNEKVKATVLAYAEDYTDLLIERLQGPGAAVLSIQSDGRILTNGTDVDLGDNFPSYLGLFDQFANIGENVKVGYSVVLDDENLVYEDVDSAMGLLYQIDIMARRIAGICKGNSAEAARYVREMMDTLETGDRAESSYPIPPEAELPDGLVRLVKEMLVVLAANISDDNIWDDSSLDRLQVNADNTWVLPGEFHSERGTWKVLPGGVTVSFDSGE